MSDCIINGRLAAASDASISIQDRGFRYGDGVFETIAIHDGVPYQFDWHISRLSRGLESVKIPFDTSILRDYCRQLLRQNKLSSGMLRIQVTRGIGSKGYLPDPTHPQAGSSFVIETSPLPIMPDKPVTLWKSNYTKVSPASLPVQFKICQGLNSTLARIEADEHGCFDALLFNDRGHICETSSGNIFWLLGGRLFTPSLACGVLEGVARAAVLRLSPYPVTEIEADIEALGNAEAVFITNAVWKALGVAELQPVSLSWSNDDIAKSIRQLLNDDREKFCAAHKSEW